MSKVIEHIDVLEPGTTVWIGNDIEAQVILSAIGNGRAVQYQVSYWDKTERKTVWLDEFEVETIGEDSTLRIGFKPD